MKPHRAEFGTRYADDSGWERFVCVDRANERVVIEMGGSDQLVFSTVDLDWLIDALTAAARATESLLNTGKPTGDA